MKLKNYFYLILPLLLLVSILNAQTLVEKHGRLSVQGNKIIDKDGNPVQLRGMSFFWSQWAEGYPFYNANVVKWLKDDWCVGVVRVAVGADSADSGYSRSANLAILQRNRAVAVIDAAIDQGIYVIIDWHSHNAHYPVNLKGARSFFAFMAQKYSGVPNVIYETWNEPLNVSWENVIKPYHRELIDTIRKYDPQSLIVYGNRQWDQRVEEAANSPLDRENVAYSLHYYANTHLQWLRDRANFALNKNVALLVTEYGTCDADGNGGFNPEESALWWTFLDDKKISYCNWSISNKNETASILLPGTSSSGGWTLENLSESGTLVRDHLLETCEITSSLSSEELTWSKPICYPNPFTTSFTIKSDGLFEYVIWDLFGKQMVKGNGIESVTVKEELSAGTYLVQIRYNSSSHFLKLNKN